MKRGGGLGWGGVGVLVVTKQFAGPGDLQVSSLLGKWREGGSGKRDQRKLYCF